KIGRIEHDGTGVMAGLESPVHATRYHSLVVERESLPKCLKINSWLENGTIMGLQHESLPIHGIQFHPESIATDKGFDILDNFLKLTH
ncbi:MAG: aminodeoxychorismate/anthranilate synthase component II, partial [Rhodobacteraceae bacterium]|nr:aminodeoxychorismate/anthranilate synthase component II [Paracoccaceae bacterium]